MTIEPTPQRRSLVKDLADIKSPSQGPQGQNLPSEEVAAHHNFDRVSMTASEAQHLRDNAVPEKPTRNRKGKRSFQLSVKIHPDAASYIYDQANNRDVPIAQIIEELVDAKIYG